MRFKKKMKNILIVGDDNKLLDMLSAAIGKHAGDYEVLTAEDSEQAEKILRERPIDVLLTDTRMPDMSDPEGVSGQKIGLAATQVFRMSADASVKAEEKPESAFVSETVKKNVTIDTLFPGIPNDRRSFLSSFTGPYR